MNAWRFIGASLRHYRRVHIAVALGVMVATAVLTGALLVGDSVRGSLRDLTLQRLGRVEFVLIAGHFFRAALADETTAANGKFKVSAEPAILLAGTLQAGGGRDVRRATGISVIGFAPSFWTLGQGGPTQPLGDGDIAITEPLARELDVNVGSEILLRVPIIGAIPADSSLGQKAEDKTSRSSRFKVAAVLPAEGIARFGLAPSQRLPRNVFVPLASLQKLIEQPAKANAILIADRGTDTAAGEGAASSLPQALQPNVNDLGLRVDEIGSPVRFVQISADQLVLPDAVVDAADNSFEQEDLQPVVTYLANTITIGEGEAARKIPYSTIVGVDSTAALGPLRDDAGQPIKLADDEIALNSWAADDLEAKVGDTVTVKYYEPESTHGKLTERKSPPFKLRVIVSLETADGTPTVAADPKLTPDLPGVTDQKSIDDWKLPFELVEKIRPQDEEYWDKYRTTPKAFVSLATAKKWWPSRWGTISLLRLPQEMIPSKAESTYVSDLLLRSLAPADLGMTFLPVKSQGLAAASGTTPFEGLFLGFSFFLIAAAVMLISLLFQLGVEQRGTELGTLAAVGVTRRQMTKLLSREGLLVAAIGATLGIIGGVLYAWLMIYGLRTWWVAAIATPFLELHVTPPGIGWPRSLLIGWLIGLAVSWLTIHWSVRRLVRQPAARLLKENAGGSSPAGSLRRRTARTYDVALTVIAIAIFAMMGFAGGLRGETQAGVFFAMGAALLAWLLIAIRFGMLSRARGKFSQMGFRLPMLAALNISRNPGRNTLTIGLVAAASFLIIAVSAFRLDTGEGGTGGFDYIATSDQPIHYDLNTPEGRLELGFSDTDSRKLEDWQVYSLRVATGEDASCLNLYRPTQPRVLGVPDSLIERGGFEWSATDQEVTSKPWTALRSDLGYDATGATVVPVVLDASTAIYSLHLQGVGDRLTIRDAGDRPVTLQVVGMLKNSVLQGNLLVSEENFLKMFPDTGGYQFFLIEENKGHAQRVVTKTDSNDTLADGTRSVPPTLESTLAADGFDVTDAREQLAGFLAVQNTYLSTFQSLGALGLLLGTIGLAVVQLRSVLERRGELALMRAGGYRRRRLLAMVILENCVLLMGGLAAGCIAAAVALLPQWAPRSAAIPWQSLALLLGLIITFGLAAGWLATRSALRAPIVPALRGD
jgi:ABC-type antimicrobial peptide transport system permease subunit